MKKALWVACIAGVGLVASACVQAQGGSSDLVARQSFTLGVFTGYQGGRAGEYLYNDKSQSTLNSKLNWHTRNAAIAGLNAAYAPLPWLTIRGQAWSVVASNGSVTDYDYMLRDHNINSWSDRSKGPTSRMDQAYGGDLTAAFAFIRQERITVEALVGYRYKSTRWQEAKSGSNYVYTPDADPSQFRTDVGHSSGRGLDYRQVWKTPFMGLALTKELGPFTLRGQVIASRWVQANFEDIHSMRALYSEGRAKRATMTGVDVGADDHLTDRWTFSVATNYEKYSGAKSNLTMLDRSTGELDKYPSGNTGMSYQTWGLNLGASYTF